MCILFCVGYVTNETISEVRDCVDAWKPSFNGALNGFNELPAERVLSLFWWDHTYAVLQNLRLKARIVAEQHDLLSYSY